MKKYHFWQILEVYSRKKFLLDEALKEVARDAAKGKAPDEALLERIGETQTWLKDFDQATCITDFDIQF